MIVEKKYKDKDWLREMYVDKQFPQNAIGILENVDRKTICYWMNKYNIPIRDRGYATHLSATNNCDLSDEAIEFIEGELLGDGCLSSQSKWTALFRYSSKYKEYAQYISDTLNSFGVKQAGKIVQGTAISGGKIHKTWHYYSRYYPELLPIRKKWYPEGKKIVPRDIKLTPLVCRQWYIGDGHLAKQVNFSIRLYTNCFTISDVEWLVSEFKRLGFKCTRRPALNIIGISTKSTKDFLDYIGECPVDCYKYKWKRR